MEFMEELHRYEKEALAALIGLCEAHGLTYYVIGGTLLGAVRHRGFIPWDDDVDIAMPRQDYDRLLCLRDSLPRPYVLEDYHFTKDFRSYFAKVRNTEIELREELTDNAADRRVGYLIDILPIDGTPNRTLCRKLYYARVMGLRFLCGAANVHTGIRTSRPKAEQRLLRLCRALRLYRILHCKSIYHRMDQVFHRQDVRCADYVGTITGAYKTREIVPRRYFGMEEPARCLPFEGLSVRVPARYENYLRHMFGDYRQLPPENERKVHYQGVIYRKQETKE